MVDLISMAASSDFGRREAARILFDAQDPDDPEQYTLAEIIAILEENAALDADLAARGPIKMPDWKDVPL